MWFRNFVERQAVQIARKREHERNFHQFGRLNLDRPDFEPALCAKPHVTDDLDSDQKKKRNQIGGIGEREPHANIDERHGEQENEADGEPHHLRRRPGIKVPACHRILHGKSDRRDDADQKNQRPVDLKQLLDPAGAAARSNIGGRHQMPVAAASSEAAFTGQLAGRFSGSRCCA